MSALGLRKLLQQVEAQRLSGLEIDDQLKLCRRFDREVGRLRALEDPIDVFGCLTESQ